MKKILKKFIPESKGLAVFSIFASVSLWIIASLDTEYKVNLTLPITIVPSKGVMVIDYEPKYAQITVRTKGKEFLNFYLKKRKIKINVNSNIKGIKEVSLTPEHIKPLINGEITIISPRKIVIHLSKRASKKVRVYADIRGKWHNKNYTVSKVDYIDSVEIEGEEEGLKLVPIVYTAPILLDTLRDTVLMASVLSPDTNFKIKPSKIKIVLHLEKEREKVFKNVKVKLSGGEGKNIKVLPELASITVSGPESLLDRLTTKDISVVIDVSDRDRGEYVLPAEIELPEGVRFVKCEPSEFKVIIE